MKQWWNGKYETMPRIHEDSFRDAAIVCIDEHLLDDGYVVFLWKSCLKLYHMFIQKTHNELVFNTFVHKP